MMGVVSVSVISMNAVLMRVAMKKKCVSSWRGLTYADAWARPDLLIDRADSVCGEAW